VLSIAASVLDVEPESDVVLVYGNRTSRDVMFLEELADLKDRFPDRLVLLHVLSREEQESELLSGRIDRERLTLLARSGLLPVESSTSSTCAGRSAWSPRARRRCSTSASRPSASTSSCSTPTRRRPAPRARARRTTRPPSPSCCTAGQHPARRR
jgi:ring-1,2-phenylacetyl-CoA epoxidase subunit PaaE